MFRPIGIRAGSAGSCSYGEIAQIGSGFHTLTEQITLNELEVFVDIENIRLMT